MFKDVVCLSLDFTGLTTKVKVLFLLVKKLFDPYWCLIFCVNTQDVTKRDCGRDFRCASTAVDTQLNASRDDQIPSRSTCCIPQRDNTKDAASLASYYGHVTPLHLKSRPYGKLNPLQGHVILRSVATLRHPLGEAPTIYPGLLALCRKLIVCFGPAVEESPLSQRGFAQAFQSSPRFE